MQQHVLRYTSLSDREAAAWFGRLGALLGRYRIIDSNGAAAGQDAVVPSSTLPRSQTLDPATAAPSAAEDRPPLAFPPPVHRSATCVVRFAVDMATHREVCLKAMRSKEQFQREVEGRRRFGPGGGIGTSRAAVRILGWHTPRALPYHGPENRGGACSGVEAAEGQQEEPTDGGGGASGGGGAGMCRETLEYPWLLVMERGGASLHLAVSSQRLAGADAGAVAALFRALVVQVARLHVDCGVVHGDVKLRNALCVRRRAEGTVAQLATSEPKGRAVVSGGGGSGSGYRTEGEDDVEAGSDDEDLVLLCDLDASAPFGTPRAANHKVGSSGYYAPEVGRWVVAQHERAQWAEERKQAMAGRGDHHGGDHHGTPARWPLPAVDLACREAWENEDEKGREWSPALVASAANDVWSLGAVLFELCTGKHLFPQDISGDEMVDAGDLTRLCLWLCVPDEALASVFADDLKCPPPRRALAKHLIRWCLQGDPAKRPTVQQILNHDFLARDGSGDGSGGGSGGGSGNSAVGVPHVASPALGAAGAFDGRRQYHVFVSHLQREAAGDVGTLSALLRAVGVHAWRDMEQADLTEAGMRAGVADSDVFLLFLTNATLSSPWCLKEVGWALELRKPMVIVVEVEERFACFDVERWRSDRCSRAPCGVGWECGPLRVPFASCPPAVRAFVEAAHAAGAMVPFRRRDFEAAALVREVLRLCATTRPPVERSSAETEAAHASAALQRTGVCWGGALPRPAAYHTAQLGARRLVRVACAAGGSRAVSAARDELSGTLARLSPGLELYDATGSAEVKQVEEREASSDDGQEEQRSGHTMGGTTPPPAAKRARVEKGPHGGEQLPPSRQVPHLVVLLTGGVLGPDGECPDPALRSAILLGRAASSAVFVYSEELGWDFAAFNALPETAVKAAIASHEALCYRPLAAHAWEHEAMALEVITRLRPTGCTTDGVRLRRIRSGKESNFL